MAWQFCRLGTHTNPFLVSDQMRAVILSSYHCRWMLWKTRRCLFLGRIAVHPSSASNCKWLSTKVIAYQGNAVKFNQRHSIGLACSQVEVRLRLGSTGRSAGSPRQNPNGHALPWSHEWLPPVGKHRPNLEAPPRSYSGSTKAALDWA